MASKFQIPIAFKSDPRGIKEAEGALDGFGKRLGGIALAVGAAFSFRAIGNFAKEAVLAAEGVATANAAIQQIAKTTNLFGAQTDQVTDRLIAFAEASEMRLAVDAEVIKGVQGQLLTFKALGASADEVGGSFDRATEAAFNMAAAGFGSAESNATQLGKALEDPVRGLSALRKSGTTFTEEQQDLIATLVESGDLLGAQGIILDELDAQYGGVAEATADASDKLTLAFDNIKETAGAALLPVFAELVEGLMPVTEVLGTALADAFTELSPVLSDIVGMLPSLLEAFVPLIPIIGELAAIFLEMVVQFLPIFVELFEQLLPVIAELAPIIADVFLMALQELMPVFLLLIESLMPIVEALLPVLLDLIITLAPVFVTLIEKMMPLIEKVLPMFIGFIEFLTPIIVWLAELLGEVLVFAVGLLIGVFEGAEVFFEEFAKFFKNLWLGIQIVFATVINGLISGFENFINFFVEGFNTLLKGINLVRKELGQSELTLAARVSFGRLEVPELTPLAVGGIVTRPTRALIGEAGPEAVIPLDKMGKMGGNTYNITVNAGLGSNGTQLGAEIVSLIKRYERSSGPVFASV
jgi:phage-related protein